MRIIVPILRAGHREATDLILSRLRVKTINEGIGTVSQPSNHGKAITLEWLGETLSHLNVGHSITAFSVSPVGATAAFLGDICRVDLTWSGGKGVPSVIVKSSTVRPDNLETGRGLLAYEREAWLCDLR